MRKWNKPLYVGTCSVVLYSNKSGANLFPRKLCFDLLDMSSNTNKQCIKLKGNQNKHKNSKSNTPHTIAIRSVWKLHVVAQFHSMHEEIGRERERWMYKYKYY